MRSELTIDEWEFISEIEGSNVNFQVETPDRRRPPSSLFKLYALNDYSIDALLNGYLYASNPSQLNDIYDCDLRLIKYDNPVLCWRQS